MGSSGKTPLWVFPVPYTIRVCVLYMLCGTKICMSFRKGFCHEKDSRTIPSTDPPTRYARLIRGRVPPVSLKSLLRIVTMEKITSPRRIARIFWNHNRQESAACDAITEFYGVSGMVADMKRNALAETIRRRTPYTMVQAEDISYEWVMTQRTKRLRFKNPIRLEWKVWDSQRRHHASMIAAQEEYYDNEVNF